MKLKEIFDQLTYGELSQLSIGGGEQGVISSSNYSRVIAHINLGLTALHKRFNLKEESFLLEFQSGQTLYLINSKYAVTGRSNQAVRYIKDSIAAPFSNNVLKMERFYTDKGVELSCNDLEDPYSVSTPSVHKLLVPADLVDNPVNFPESLITKHLKVFYRANHLAITNEDNDIDPEEVEVELPDAYLDPLLLFVASRVHTPTGMTNEFNMGNNYYAKYEAACQELETYDLDVDQVSQPDRLGKKGFV